MINLTSARRAIDEAVNIINELDGQQLDETEAIASQSRGAARKRRAEMSQDLQLAATRLELAAGLVRVEYWHARGENDPTRPGRTD